MGLTRRLSYPHIFRSLTSPTNPSPHCAIFILNFKLYPTFSSKITTFFISLLNFLLLRCLIKNFMWCFVREKGYAALKLIGICRTLSRRQVLDIRICCVATWVYREKKKPINILHLVLNQLSLFVKTKIINLNVHKAPRH